LINLNNQAIPEASNRLNYNIIHGITRQGHAIALQEFKVSPITYSNFQGNDPIILKSV
jgi:hypothetical protein